MFGLGRKNSGKNVIRRVSDNAFSFFGIGGSQESMPASPEQALECATVLACMRTISEGVAQTPLRVIKTEKSGDIERTSIAKDHWAHKLLQKPNNFQTRFEFLETMMNSAILGSGALAIKTQYNGQVRELIPVPSGMWVMEQLQDNSVQFRVTYSDGRPVVYQRKDVVFFHNTSLDGYSSMPAVKLARRAVGISNGLENTQLSHSANGGRPSGILSYEEVMSGHKRQEVEEDWAEKFAPIKAGKIAVIDAGVKFTPIPVSSADAQFIENRRFQVTEIARIFRVHPAYVFGDSDINRDVLKWHVQNTLMPWISRFTDALNQDLLGDEDGFEVDFDERDWLRGDHTAMAAFFKAALGSGGSPAWMSLNEIRIECGLDPIDDDFYKTPSKGGYELAKTTNHKSGDNE